MHEAKLFHYSSSQNRSSIQSRGLLTEKDNTGMEAIFLTDVSDPGNAGEGCDEWAVDAAGLELEVDFTTAPSSGNWHVSFNDIPPHRLSLSRPSATLA